MVRREATKRLFACLVADDGRDKVNQ